MRPLVLTLTAALTLSLAGAQVPDSAAIPSLDKYGNKYANLRLERTPDGVLTVTMHTRGGPSSSTPTPTASSCRPFTTSPRTARTRS